MLTIKKNQTVKIIKPIKVGQEILEKGTILTIDKGGKNPLFFTRLNNEIFAFSMGAENAKNCIEDVIVESKLEKDISNITLKNLEIFKQWMVLHFLLTFILIIKK